MIEHADRPFDSLMTAIPFRGTRDDAINGYHPEINAADPEAPRFGSSPDVPSQRWVALVLSERETEALLRLTAVMRESWVFDIEGRYVAQQANRLIQACIEDFVGYEQRKAEDQPASLPVSS